MYHSASTQPEDLSDLSLCHVIENGFPTAPLCSAYSPNLSALAFGTKTGEVRLVGKQNVQFLYNLRSFEEFNNGTNNDFGPIFDQSHISHLVFIAENKSTCKLAAIVNYAHIVILELLKKGSKSLVIIYSNTPISNGVQVLFLCRNNL